MKLPTEWFSVAGHDICDTFWRIDEDGEVEIEGVNEAYIYLSNETINSMADMANMVKHQIAGELE